MILNGSVANGSRAPLRGGVFFLKGGAALALAALALIAASSAHAEKLSLERLFAAPDLSGPSLRAIRIVLGT